MEHERFDMQPDELAAQTGPPGPAPTGSDLEPSDSPQAGLEGDLASLGDDEYFAAQQSLPPGVDDEGRQYDPMEGVIDERDRS